MRVLITGAGGMLGRALCRQLDSGFEVVACNSSQLDITDAASVHRTLEQQRPDWIVHAAAFTDVDGAESRPEEAFRVNACGTRNVAASAHALGCRLLYYSTDYVFDGSSDEPLREWDPLCPINTYGRSKAAGETFVQTLCPQHLIVRTSWLYGPGGVNFVSRILERASAGIELQVVDDQRGSPTYAPDLAQASARLLELDRRGIYHVTNSGHCSWFEFASRVLETTGSETSIRPVPSTAFPTPAARPAFSVLDNIMWRLDGQEPQREWTEALGDYLDLQQSSHRG